MLGDKIVVIGKMEEILRVYKSEVDVIVDFFFKWVLLGMFF